MKTTPKAAIVALVFLIVVVHMGAWIDGHRAGERAGYHKGFVYSWRQAVTYYTDGWTDCETAFGIRPTAHGWTCAACEAQPDPTPGERF